MTFDIHVTIELQPSPQLVELLQAMQPADHKIRPQPGPQDSKLPVKPTIGDLEKLQPAGPEPPQIKPQEAGEQPKDQPPVHRHVHQIVEVPAFSEFTTEKPVHIFGNLSYAESENGLVMIKYLSGTIYTLWSEIMKACRDQIYVKPVPQGKGGNKHTALNQFIKAVEGGLRKGQAKTKGKISNSEFWTEKEKTPRDQKEAVDPDADFRPMLNQDTHIAKDGNKLEGSLED